MSKDESKSGARHSAADIALLNALTARLREATDLALQLGAVEEAEAADEPQTPILDRGLEQVNATYAKAIRPDVDLDALMCKSVGRDEIRGYVVMWGNPAQTDIEREYFTPETDFWDSKLPLPKPLTWDHGQDPNFKSAPVTVGHIREMGDDGIGRWYTATLERGHKYRAAIDALINAKALGTSSDSAPQYVLREARGKSIWLKQWPLFAAALTPTPCEPRMLDVGSLHWKAIANDLQGRMAALDSAKRTHDLLRLTLIDK